jgi:hypothetical protein
VTDDLDLSNAGAPRSDQLNADDLVSGPRTITVTGVKKSYEADKLRVSLSFSGDGGRPYKPCKGMLRLLFEAWGTNGAAYIGRQMTLFRDPSVKFGTETPGGIRISHLSHIEKDFTAAVTVSKARRVGWRVCKIEHAQPPKPVALPQDAEAAAKGGTEAFRAWWAGATQDQRAAAKPHMDRLKIMASEADAQVDPFTAAPADIAAQVMAELSARDAQMEA